MSVTPRDQVLRRQLHQLKGASEQLHVLATWFDARDDRGDILSDERVVQTDLRRWANAIQYVLDNVDLLNMKDENGG